MALLRVEKNNGIATVYLNRPEKRNAMSFALLKELVATAKKIEKDRSIRCVILTGEAQVFSAGIDLSDLNNPKNTAFAAWELIKPGQSLFQKAFLIWQNLPIPVIAAIEGYCFGCNYSYVIATWTLLVWFAIACVDYGLSSFNFNLFVLLNNCNYICSE